MNAIVTKIMKIYTSRYQNLSYKFIFIIFKYFEITDLQK